MSENDGRFIDTAIATLEGEASHQISPTTVPAVRTERPILKEPVWVWAVPAYFLVGGVAGAAMTLGMAAQLLGGRRLASFEERCRWTGAIAGGIGSVLLVYDLGRHERFLYMLRVFRPTSPMSVGSWLLAIAAPMAGAAAIMPGTLPGHLAGIASGVLGMPLATYTAVLLGNTAVPIWSETRRSLPFLFGASSVASMASLFELMPLSDREWPIVCRFGLWGRIAELVATAAFEDDARRRPRVARPLREGIAATLWNTASVCAVASLAVAILPGKSRQKRMVSGVLGLMGGACLRFAVFYAGKQSARDPHAA